MKTTLSSVASATTATSNLASPRAKHSPAKCNQKADDSTDIEVVLRVEENADRSVQIRNTLGSSPPSALHLEAESAPLNDCLSPWPLHLTSTQSLLMDHYIQRFSRSYPTCSGPGNPFISVLLPLAMRNKTVLNSLLALSGTQSWDGRNQRLEGEALRCRQHALEGCRRMIERFETTDDSRSTTPQDQPVGEHAQALNTKVTDQEQLVLLLTSCMMLLVFEKLSGEGRSNWKPHLDFIAQLLHRYLNLEHSFSLQAYEAFQFIRRCFLYADLVASVVQDVQPLSDFYSQSLRLETIAMSVATDSGHEVYTNKSKNRMGRDYFPSLIARISSGDRSVSRANIYRWDGRLDWLPSFALTASGDESESVLEKQQPLLSFDPAHGGHGAGKTDKDEELLIAEIYRAAADIHRQRKLYDSESLLSTSSTEAVKLIQMLPRGSRFESTLLWPIGIIARELTTDHLIERAHCLQRLRWLEERFRFKHFRRSQETIVKHWQENDRALSTRHNRPSGVDMILLG